MRPGHAGARLVERFDGSVSLYEIEQKVKAGVFRWKRRLSGTRSLCLTVVQGRDIWFVLDRSRRAVVTVLTEDQGKRTMSAGQDEDENEEDSNSNSNSNSNRGE